MLDAQGRLLVAHTGQEDVTLLPHMANRHGLITGATGSGKTVTLQTLAEGFSALGTPVFVTDIKGDLSGVAMPGLPSGKVAERVAALHLAERGYASQGLSGLLLGCVCRGRAPPARHGKRNGSSAAVASART